MQSFIVSYIASSVIVILGRWRSVMGYGTWRVKKWHESWDLKANWYYEEQGTH